MNILFCSHNPLDLRLGAPKALMETAAALEKLGHTCTLASDEQISPGIGRYTGIKKIKRFSEALANFLDIHAKNFDVVEFEHLYLPYPRARFSPRTLLVARSVLLTHHFEKIKIPRYRRLRSWIGHLLKGYSRAQELKYSISVADNTFSNCDLIKVNNTLDRIELIKRHFNSEKIIVVADGISQARLALFKHNSALPLPVEVRIAFVGTFDLRKGAREFPQIVCSTLNTLPDCKFKLLGSRYLSKDQILAHFPKWVHPNLEIITEYDPNDLPELLKDCTMGIFPSYIEGFGIGVLEMLAAALPVIAYDSPGPPMMLPKKWLVPRGEAAALTHTVLTMLSTTEELTEARVWAKNRAQDFTWEAAAAELAHQYSTHLKKLREK